MKKSQRFKGYNYWPVFLIKYFNNFIKYFHNFITSYHRQKVRCAFMTSSLRMRRPGLHARVLGWTRLTRAVLMLGQAGTPLNSEIATSRTCLT